MRSRTRTAQIAMVDVSQHLIVRIGMNRVHDTVLDTDRLVEHLRERRKTVRRARRVRDDRVASLEHIVVDAVHDGRIDLVTRGSGNDDFLRAGLEMRRGLVLRREKTRALEHDVNAELAPRQVRRIALGANRDAVAVDDEV